MEQMKEESERLAKQQERLEKMTGDSGPGELLSLICESHGRVLGLYYANLPLKNSRFAHFFAGAACPCRACVLID